MSWARTSKLGAYAGLAAAALLAAPLLRCPELVAVATPLVVTVAVGLLSAQPPSLRVTLRLARDRAVEGEEVEAELHLHAITAVERLEVRPVLPEGIELAAAPPLLRLEAGEGRVLRLRLRCRRWGGHLVGPVHLRATDRLGLLVARGGARRASPPQGLPSAGAAARCGAGGPHPAAGRRPSGSPRRRRRGVRRTPSVCARRPNPADQLAGQRPPRRPACQPAAPRAQRRRGAVPGHLHRGPQPGGGHAGPDGAGGGRPGRPLPRPQGPGRRGRLRRLPALAVPGQWPRPRLARPGRAAGDPGRYQLRRQDHPGRPGAHAAPRRPSAGAHAAAGRARHPRPAGPARPRLRRGAGNRLPSPFVRPGPGETGQAAFRLWCLQREALQHHYQRLGVAVAEWHPDRPLEAVTEEVRTFQRRARRHA